MLFDGFRDSVRRNIKKAQRESIDVRFETDMVAVRNFYRLNCLTRREHGLPPQPWTFFMNLYDLIISKGFGVVVLGFFQDRPVAANVYLYSNGGAIYKYGASDRKYQSLRASNLLMWEAIRRFAGEGCKQLCFGRTEPENDGLRQFKTGWGARERIINYYRYHPASESFLPMTRGLSRAASRLFASVPLVVSRAIGNAFYRHVG
jgi:lipid II:glycine glycyltransferase (peptidoglycan interpeptide bridge formation enzyme)